MASSTKSRSARQARPSVEALEQRALLAGSIGLSAGVLTINGTEEPDNVYVRYGKDAYGNDRVYAELHYDIGVVQYYPGGTVYYLEHVAELADFPAWQVSKIVFNGGEGADYFGNRTWLPSVANGGDGWDVLDGGMGNDELNGGDGYDKLVGNCGQDVLRGGADGDILDGGCDADQLFGDEGDDYLKGGMGTDADQLTGGAGADTFVGEWFGPWWWRTNRDNPTDWNFFEGDRVV
jgi:Ca2+-binding RTX toxin-like protein